MRTGTTGNLKHFSFCLCKEAVHSCLHKLVERNTVVQRLF